MGDIHYIYIVYLKFNCNWIAYMEEGTILSMGE